MSEGYLLVRAEGRAYGLPLGRVLGVDDIGDVLEVPRVLAAMRGVTPWRGRLVPLVHLGALLGNRAAPDARGQTVVLVDAGRGQRLVALEVDDAEEVIREAALPFPSGESLPWAVGVARREEGEGEGAADVGGGGLVPILDFTALEERLA